MTLLARQAAFLAEIAADDDAAPPSSPGMAIYRDAYRGRLLAALEASFERTRRWTGEAGFATAACHHVLAHPPSGWTLDAYGADFPETLASLFAEDPEVAELAWLEWHLNQAFAAPDRPVLDPAALAAEGHAAADWDAMRFTMAAGFAARPVATNCTALWAALADGAVPGFTVLPETDAAVLVWRQGMIPRFRLALRSEARCLQDLEAGATLGKVAAGTGPEQLGQWLAAWFGEGIFSEVGVATALPFTAA